MLRDCRDWFGDTGPLQAFRDRQTMAIAEHEKKQRSASEQSDRLRMESYHLRLAAVTRMLGHYSNQANDWRNALANDDSGKDSRPIKAFLLAQQGEYARAESEAATLAASDRGNGHGYFMAAQICARMVTIAGDDRSLALASKKALSDHLGTLAVEWLRQAQTRKYLSAPSTRWLLADDRDLDALRARADFRALLATRERASKSPE
jgi:hypothetical protein